MRQTEHNYITRVAWNKNNGAASSVLTESWSSHINMITCTLCYISVCDMFMNWRPQNVLMGEEFNVGWLTVAPYMLITAHLRRIQPSWKDESVHTYTLWLNGCFILTNEERDFFSLTELSDPPPPPILSLHPQLDPGQLLSESHMVQIESNASYCKKHTKAPGLNTGYKFACKWAISVCEHEQRGLTVIISVLQIIVCLHVEVKSYSAG